jgi:hypothetical protein
LIKGAVWAIQSKIVGEIKRKERYTMIYARQNDDVELTPTVRKRLNRTIETRKIRKKGAEWPTNSSKEVE